MGQGIHETHGAIEIAERELAVQAGGLLIQGPGRVEAQQQFIGGGARQGRHATFAGLTASVGQLSHGVAS
jgi:hypothetical protein